MNRSPSPWPYEVRIPVIEVSRRLIKQEQARRFLSLGNWSSVNGSVPHGIFEATTRNDPLRSTFLLFFRSSRTTKSSKDSRRERKRTHTHARTHARESKFSKERGSINVKLFLRVQISIVSNERTSPPSCRSGTAISRKNSAEFRSLRWLLGHAWPIVRQVGSRPSRRRADHHADTRCRPNSWRRRRIERSRPIFRPVSDRRRSEAGGAAAREAPGSACSLVFDSRSPGPLGPGLLGERSAGRSSVVAGIAAEYATRSRTREKETERRWPTTTKRTARTDLPDRASVPALRDARSATQGQRQDVMHGSCSEWTTVFHSARPSASQRFALCSFDDKINRGQRWKFLTTIAHFSFFCVCRDTDRRWKLCYESTVVSLTIFGTNFHFSEATDVSTIHRLYFG